VQQDGGSEDEAIAALLHDALEDKPDETSEAVIRDRFGEQVAHMVRIATDTPVDWVGGPKPPWRERKEMYLDRVATEPREFLRPTVADKIDNIRAIVVDHRRVGDAVWSRFSERKERQLWYYSECLGAYERAGASPTLLGELRVLVRELERVVGTGRPSA
jgi:(p)ppGpp synthase/HD superfamily hydrolase